MFHSVQLVVDSLQLGPKGSQSPGLSVGSVYDHVVDFGFDRLFAMFDWLFGYYFSDFGYDSFG